LFSEKDEDINPMIKSKLFLLMSLSIVLLAGCSEKFLDPKQIGRFRPVPAVNVILDSLGVAEEEPSPWVGAEQPKPIDLIAYETDYTFAPGDTVRITIFELLQQGQSFINEYVVTETGKISIPEVGVVEAIGLTESQLEDEIARILSPTILKEPSITVTLLNSEKRTFSISGNGVPRPGRYQIPRYDFRLLDALAEAGGIDQFNISYVYVSRQITGEERDAGQFGNSENQAEITEKTQKDKKLEVPENEMLEIIAPSAKKRHHNDFYITSAEMVTEEELTQTAAPQGLGVEVEPIEQQGADDFEDTEENMRSIVPRGQDGGSSSVEWVFKDGKWIPVRKGEPEKQAEDSPQQDLAMKRELESKVPEDFTLEQLGQGQLQTRVIKIPADKLNSGDPRYNIIIRRGDSIQVPVDIIGEFCIMGNVNNQGYVNLTGRPMTLKMAIAAAGGLGELAWPKKCEIVRRIGKKKEEIVLVDLDKIARGEQPDFFIKPNDLINVGTHPTSVWRSVIRNAFRATYGFGFIYDRNFADRSFGFRDPLGPFGI
jgi:polysaccharide export outer membrane protein